VILKIGREQFENSRLFAVNARNRCEFTPRGRYLV
jgi:hypothetical protein